MNEQGPLQDTSEVLTQSEVERLLSQVQSEETSTVVLKTDGGKSRFKIEDIEPCDFRQPAFLTTGEMRKIRLRHEEFIRSLAARLSIYLRMEVSIQMSKLQTLSYQQLTEGMASPTHLTLFKVEPLKGYCLLEIPPRLGLTIVDRLLGGPAHSVNANRDLSEIEVALLDQACQNLLNEWCTLWQKVSDLRPAILGHETNGRFLRSSPHDTVMLVLSMEVRMGDCMEQMQLAFPFMTIEPLVRQLSLLNDGETDPQSKPPARVAWNRDLDEVKIRIEAEWHGLQISARELACLQPGDILMLDPQCFQHVEVRLERITKFRGRLGTCGDNWAVELTTPLKS